MPVRIVVIAEAPADQRHVCALIDRKILHHAPDWFDAPQLDHERTWCGLEAGGSFTRWTTIPSLPAARRGFGLGVIGFDPSAPHKHDYPSTRKVLLLCAQANPAPDAVLLIRDLDNQAVERRASIEAARGDAGGARFRVVLALPNAKREAWALNGFEPADAPESSRMQAMRDELGFDPCRNAHRLDAQTPHSKRDAKRILNHLTSGCEEREARCWNDAAWEILRNRGVESGLSRFLDEAKDLLLPLIFSRPRA